MILQHRRASDFASNALHKTISESSISKPRPKPASISLHNSNRLLLANPSTPKKLSNDSDSQSGVNVVITPASNSFFHAFSNKKKNSNLSKYSTTTNVHNLPSPSSPPAHRKLEQDFFTSDSKLPYQSIAE